MPKYASLTEHRKTDLYDVFEDTVFEDTQRRLAHTSDSALSTGVGGLVNNPSPEDRTLN